MDRFMNIKEKLLALAKEDKDIKAIVLIGSSTRDTDKAGICSICYCSSSKSFTCTRWSI